MSSSAFIDSFLKNKEFGAGVAAILFLALGFLAVWLMNDILEVKQEAVFVSVLLVPVLVYVIVSGRLSEIKGPGGLEAKFFSTAGQSVELSAQPVQASMDQMQEVQKGGLQALQSQLMAIDESKPIVLRFTAGMSNYDRYAALEYIRALSQYRNFKFAVILDQDSRLTAYIPAWSLRQTLESESLGSEFVNLLNSGRLQELLRFPAVKSKTITTRTTNLEALREMASQNLEALVVVDEEGRLKGVVEREQVISSLMLAMAK